MDKKINNPRIVTGSNSSKIQSSSVQSTKPQIKSEFGSKIVHPIKNENFRMYIESYNDKKINLETTACLICGQIRAEFYKALNVNGEKFDVDTFKYIDENLFKSISYLISSSIKYGKSKELNTIVHQHISNFLDSFLEYTGYTMNENSMNKFFMLIDDVV